MQLFIDTTSIVMFCANVWNTFGHVMLYAWRHNVEQAAFQNTIDMWSEQKTDKLQYTSHRIGLDTGV